MNGFQSPFFFYQLLGQPIEQLRVRRTAAQFAEVVRCVQDSLAEVIIATGD